jgi:hypothetical protein
MSTNNYHLHLDDKIYTYIYYIWWFVSGISGLLTGAVLISKSTNLSENIIGSLLLIYGVIGIIMGYRYYYGKNWFISDEIV